jgi:hypothetical protein
MFDGNGALTSGDLRINDVLRARFYSAVNVPPALPTPQNGMLANVAVAGVGTFNYDLPGPFSFSRNSGCF